LDGWSHRDISKEIQLPANVRETEFFTMKTPSANPLSDFKRKVSASVQLSVQEQVTEGSVLMSEKAKQLGNSILDKSKKGFFRIKHSALTSIGKAEKTVDVSYQQEKDRFLDHYKNVENLNKEANNLLKVMKDLNGAMNVLMEDFHSLFDTNCAGYNTSLKAQDVARLMDQGRMEFEQQMKTDFIDPVGKYLAQFKEIKNKTDLRDTRCVDMDRYAKEVKTYQEKANKSKLDATEQKLEVAKNNYLQIHNELLDLMPALYEDRLIFFEPVLATYITAMAEYNRNSAKNTAEVLGLVQTVDRTIVHGYPKVITPIEKSAAANSTIVKPGATVPLSSSPSATSAPIAAPVVTPSAPVSSPAPALAPTPAAAPKLPQAKALYDFAASEEGELPFKVGDVITILNTSGEWWEGKLNGKQGLLPSNYVQLIS